MTNYQPDKIFICRKKIHKKYIHDQIFTWPNIYITNIHMTKYTWQMFTWPNIHFTWQTCLPGKPHACCLCLLARLPGEHGVVRKGPSQSLTRRIGGVGGGWKKTLKIFKSSYQVSVNAALADAKLNCQIRHFWEFESDYSGVLLIFLPVARGGGQV